MTLLSSLQEDLEIIVGQWMELSCLIAIKAKVLLHCKTHFTDIHYSIIWREKNMGKLEKVIVAVKASKEISKSSALIWALTHVVQPGHSITLLVVTPCQSSDRKFWGFPRFSGDCASIHRKSNSETIPEQKVDITDSCSQMILQLHDVYDKVNMKIKEVSGTPGGVVAAEAKKFHASWVVLDKKLKHEQKSCMEELQCNVVIMKKSQPKVLRLNLAGSPKKETKSTSPKKSPEKQEINKNTPVGPTHVTPASSPEIFTATEPGTSPVSSSDPATSPFSVPVKSFESFTKKKKKDLTESSSDSETERDHLSSSSSSLRFQPRIIDILTSSSSSYIDDVKITKNKSFINGSVREAISLSRNTPSGPPPLCSICLHKAPVVGKPPRWFKYSELELATGDFHLYGRHQDRLEWSARQKIAVGAARGLRYLHEECRVGCIVHRDVRPNNILITHDFEPLVGDFGLARWQPDGDKGEATRVIGTFGYLAPEYAESGEVTEKADVYSFGVVLLELVSGRKAVDINRPKGQQCLTEWARPLLRDDAVHELIDPRLGNCYSEHEVCCMLQAASLCIKRNPHVRPRMSQVLRILEGDVMMESSHV
ncbi:hypothetical protein L2E82_27703 [Cichorium intybus]|uniref:Uncharacterized protein n=1 Tax=Cichorium intybus TaxID=13427 RepID=A0ACB9CTK1_CICIN|nr:hypothetical protein L2E82_27703 [Cichorium intybus]